MKALHRPTARAPGEPHPRSQLLSNRRERRGCGLPAVARDTRVKVHTGAVVTAEWDVQVRNRRGIEQRRSQPRRDADDLHRLEVHSPGLVLVPRNANHLPQRILVRE